MTNRYAFWRDEKGAAHRKNDGKNAPHEILAAWGKAAKINQDGKPSWDLFSVLQYEATLKMVFVIEEEKGKELDETDAWSIAQNALRTLATKSGGGKAIKSEEFLALADAAASTFIRSHSKPYLLLTSVSLARFRWKSIKIGGCTISPVTDRTKFRQPEAISSLPHVKRHLENTKYQWVTISTSGRSVHEAARRAIDALSLLRAIATLTFDAGRMRIDFGPRTAKPLSIVHSGPVYTLHELNGAALHDDRYWLERIQREDQQLFNPSGGIQRMLPFLRSRILRISRLPYRTEVEQLLLRYIAALDNIDHDLSFLQMWSILEKITDTIGARYDVTIRRATWWFQDRAVAKQILDCSRIHRNRFVHSSRTSGEPDQAAYLIKSLVEPHLVSLINRAFGIPTLEEYSEILDQPVDPTTLETIKRRLKFAQRIHGESKNQRGASDPPK